LANFLEIGKGLYLTFRAKKGAEKKPSRIVGQKIPLNFGNLRKGSSQVILNFFQETWGNYFP